MTLPTARDIMNWFLYGKATQPSNLIDDALIRPASATVAIQVDRSEFMAGPGRFALGSQFPLVQDFFADTTLPPGTYTKQQLGARHGLSFYGLAFQEGDFDDGSGDYGERTFIWGSVAFQISDSAKFVVGANGKKEIENFSVEPLIKGGAATDNFRAGRGNLDRAISGISA
jgi:hypothetical protein